MGLLKTLQLPAMKALQLEEKGEDAKIPALEVKEEKGGDAKIAALVQKMRRVRMSRSQPLEYEIVELFLTVRQLTA